MRFSTWARRGSHAQGFLGVCVFLDTRPDGAIGILQVLVHHALGVEERAARRRRPPRVSGQVVGKTTTSVYYEGEPYRGKPTRVFAILAKPEHVERRSPGIVLIHGGGGTAFQEWAELWAKRGYVALAMDLAGQGPRRQKNFRMAAPTRTIKRNSAVRT